MHKLTEDQKQRQSEAIKQAAESAGSKAQLARDLSAHTGLEVSQQNVMDFINKGMQGAWAIPMHQVTGIDLFILHPILYPKNVVKYIGPKPQNVIPKIKKTS